MFLFEAFSFSTFLVILGFLAGLILLNEIARFNKWLSIFMFIVVPIVLTIFVWPKTAVSGSGAGSWFQWAKAYSALIGCIGGMAIRYIPKLRTNKIALCFPPFILAVNILEAVIRDFQLTSVNGLVDGMMTIGGPWNIMNGIAGILNIITICGWFGIVITNDKKRDLVWPDMMWFWIIAYDLWNLAYVYNSVSNRAMYSGVVLLLACTIPAFFIKKGAWALHRVQTLAFMMLFTLSVPSFFSDPRFAVKATQTPAAYYTLSILALAANVAVAGYQLYTIIKRKKNPLKDELYSHTKEYQKILDAELMKNAAVVVTSDSESEKEKDKTLVL